MKHLHFIWIGSPLPNKYVDNLERFVLNNPAYQINLWVDRHTAPIPKVVIQQVESLPLLNQPLYEREKNWGARADILRYEIVYHHGGVYNDIDALSLQPFDARFDRPFVSHTFEPWNNLTNAVFGFPRRHPFLATVIERLRDSNHSNITQRTGPYFFTYCFLDYYGGRTKNWRDFCAESLETSFIHQDLLVYPRRSTETDRYVGFTYHLNDANWTVPKPKETPKVSFCTAIKNRLDHLKQTLPQNIADRGPLAELVILDYDSNDGLEQWLTPFISNRLITYRKVVNQPYWQNSHAKNISSLLATADIICNVDADNFITAGFADYLIQFYESGHGIMTAPPATEGVTGRIALRKKDFITLGGYNENFNLGWGCEDIDLVARARGAGLEIHTIDQKYLRQIPHNNELRGRCAKITDITLSNQQSLALMAADLQAGRFVANHGRSWGQCDFTTVAE